MAATVSPTPTQRSRLASWLPVALVALTLALALTPLGVGFSGGITKETAPDPGAFAEEGCTSCHGDHSYGPSEPRSLVNVVFTDENGAALSGPYEHDATYTITITLAEQNAPEAGNRAGFNLRASAGTLEAVDGSSQTSGDGAEAAHVNAGAAEWTVMWTAPAEGVVIFDLWVNDVDGSGAPDPGDHVYNVGFFLKDDTGALPGAAAEEHEIHFGVSLQQYWIGLIGLAGMLFIMAFAFVYMKYSNPHNTDQKDQK